MKVKLMTALVANDGVFFLNKSLQIKCEINMNEAALSCVLSGFLKAWRLGCVTLSLSLRDGEYAYLAQ